MTIPQYSTNRLPLHPLFQWLKQTPIAARPSHFVGAYAATTSKTLFEVEVFTPHKAHIPAMNWEHVANCCQLLPTCGYGLNWDIQKSPLFWGVHHGTRVMTQCKTQNRPKRSTLRMRSPTFCAKWLNKKHLFNL